MKTTLRIFILLLVIFAAHASLTAQADNPLRSIFEQDDLKAFKQAEKDETRQLELFQHSLNYGAEKICSHLLAEGMDANLIFEGGATPLITAVNSQQPGIVRILLDHGADPNKKATQGLEATPLMYASSRNALEVPKMLWEKGAKVNLVDNNGDPALNWATYYGNTQVMRWLISLGADLSIKSKHGTPADVGLRLWHADSVMEVFRETGAYLSLSKTQESLFEAVQSNELKRAQKLLKKPALANSTDALGTPLLQLVVQENKIAMCRLLLEKGADPNAMNRVGMTPLAFAARFGHAECVRLMLEAGADPNLTGKDYRLTALMGAAVSGDIGIAQKLVEAGAELDTRDVVNECAALHWAMFYNHEEIELWFLEKGAAYTDSVLAGQYTARSMAELLNHEVIVSWIDSKNLIDNKIRGSWNLSEIVYIQADTSIQVAPALEGRFTFSDTHYHLVYNPWTNQRKAFANLSQPTDQEIKQAFQTIVFNSGSYTCTDSMVVATPDIARVPGFEGGKQYYRYEWVDDALHLTLFDETYPDGTKPDWYQNLEVLFKLVRE